MHFPLLADIVIILGLAVIVVLIFNRLKLPTVIGFLITGIIAGPYGLSLITASNAVEVMAEVGIILLLFIIGLEFSLKTLATIKQSVFVGGSFQVGATIVLVGLLALLFDFTWQEALFLGFLFSLSSTAIVLKILQQKNELNSPHGKFLLAVLVFQDIIVVPMMLFTPLIGGQAGNVTQELLILTVKVIFIIAFVLVSARFLVPKLLYLVVKTRSEELFILCIVVICFATAWLTSTLGLSLALGAFMAGLIISESEYNYQATGHIIPFREIFSSFFFVSIGMLLDVSFLIKNFHIILFFCLLTLIIKTTIATVAALIVQYPIRTALLAGFSIFQVGEFAFILSKVGLDVNILSADVYQYFLAVSILTMAFTPFIMQKNHKITSFLISKSFASRLQRHFFHANPAGTVSLTDHVIIIGFGLNGRNVAKAAKRAGISYVIIEMNAETVVKEKQEGEPIIYGDAARPNILHHVAVLNARVVVIAISDPKSTKQIVVNIKQINPKIHIIVRARFIQEIDEFIRLGANEVIPEEFETSIEIFTRVLNKYLIPRKIIEEFTTKIRSDNYDMLRHPANAPFEVSIAAEIPEIEIASFSVLNHKNEIVGKSVAEAKLREVYHVNVVAIRRGNNFITSIKGETKIIHQDILYVFGKPDDIQKISEKLG